VEGRSGVCIFQGLRKSIPTFPVLAVLVYDLIVFAGALSQKSADRKQVSFLSVLFFCSGMPALIYEIVWQRALFAIYGINAESVAVVVSAFMLGLGLGSLAGGWLATRFPRQSIVLFGLLELGTALFGLVSLQIFHWTATFTAGANLPSVILFSLALPLLPTMCMGATLPLLAEHLVLFSGRVGYSVATLYFANTFGSAVACYLCATFLLRDFGEAGSVRFAALLNALVGVTAFLLGRSQRRETPEPRLDAVIAGANKPTFGLAMAMMIAGLSAFIALGLEIAWFRVFVLASSDRAPAFALLLSTYLAGVAAGSYIAGKLTDDKPSAKVARTIGVLMLLAGAISPYLPSLVAFLKWKNLPFLLSAFAFFITAAFTGAVLPLLCRLSVPAGKETGRGVSLIYVSNIIGSASGSLVIGFVLMNRFDLRQISVQLGVAAVVAGSVILFPGRTMFRNSPARTVAAVIAALAVVLIAPLSYRALFERLTFGASADLRTFSHIVENRNGVIEVTQEGAVFGNGVYDGYYNVDPNHDVNGIVRAFALSAFHPAPAHILMIGLSSGSWAQVLVNNPNVESLEIVEINPGYLRLITQYPAIRSLLQNSKARIHIDDGRRWLLAHPEAHYDVIVQNTSFYWRDHSSDLLSVDYLRIVRQHLNHSGLYYFNTTGSTDVVATGLAVFPYGLRVLNFLAVSDSPIELNKDRWLAALRQYNIDGRFVFDPTRPEAGSTLARYMALADSVNLPPTPNTIEPSESLNARIKNPLIITDNNMGWEWRELNQLP
jgi:spermidine synthase